MGPGIMDNGSTAMPIYFNHYTTEPTQSVAVVAFTICKPAPYGVLAEEGLDTSDLGQAM